MDPLKGRKKVCQRRDDCFALLPGIVLMESRKIPEDDGGGRNRPVFLLTPSPLCFPSFFSCNVLKLHTLKYPAEPLIGFENAEVIDTVASGEVQEDKGEDNLLICPSPGLYVKMTPYAFSRIEDRGKVQPYGKACERGHTAHGLFFFVLQGYLVA